MRILNPPYEEEDKKPKLIYETGYIDCVKVPMPGFMAEKEHSKISAYSAAEKRKRKKDLFGNSPCAELCLDLIKDVENEGNERYASENHSKDIE